jgi:hypothetical protein
VSKAVVYESYLVLFLQVYIVKYEAKVPCLILLLLFITKIARGDAGAVFLFVCSFVCTAFPQVQPGTATVDSVYRLRVEIIGVTRLSPVLFWCLLGHMYARVVMPRATQL